MYCDHFGFREPPFDNTPDPHFFYPTPDHEEALATLIYGVSRYKGFLMLSGEVGTGKTLVSRVMLKKLGDSIVFANIANTYVSPLELLQATCDEFGIDYPADAGNLHLSRLLEGFLLDQFAQNTPVVLIVDEAQNLSHEAFEQLRMIGNLESDDAKLLQIVMVGQCELKSLFQKPELRQLRQRIFRSYHLPALGRKECQGYIEHRLRIAGHPDGQIFPADAIDSIAAFSKGLPRTINNICDSTLLAAYSSGAPITQGLVRKVIEQMMTLEHETQRSIVHPVESMATPSAAEPASTHRTGDQETEVHAHSHTDACEQQRTGVSSNAAPDVEVSEEVLTSTSGPFSTVTADVDSASPVAPATSTISTIENAATDGLAFATDRKVINTREQRILDRLAAIRRDTAREFTQDRVRVAAQCTMDYEGPITEEPQGPTFTFDGDGTHPRPSRRDNESSAIAALRKCVAECRVALGQLANLDGRDKNFANSVASAEDDASFQPVLALQPDDHWLAAV